MYSYTFVIYKPIFKIEAREDEKTEDQHSCLDVQRCSTGHQTTKPLKVSNLWIYIRLIQCQSSDACE